MATNKIRVSIGSAAVLGLVNAKIADAVPTTCYLMTYKPGQCVANCGFCPQARSYEGHSDKLSRVTWPLFTIKKVLTKLKYLPPSKRFKRICIQTLNYPNNFEDLIEIIPLIRKKSSTPISIAIPPMSRENLQELRLIGVQRVGIALDAATEETFGNIKGERANGPYKWEDHLQTLTESTEIFGKNSVSTHIIVGLGDSHRDILTLISDLRLKGILTALFAFTPIKGTKLEKLSQPSIISFRKVQLANYLITQKDKTLNDVTFNTNGKIINFNINKRELKEIIDNSEAFLTTGCPNCNRPYYTSRPSGPIYNYPRNLNEEEKFEIFNQLKKFVKL
ncbi:MAG: radical SAM protein [Candidatus Lokiarchaeota archaeon]|nr:radical SAM protein [Candidatus Lokiarchaeota archaeon]MBD3201247.1 radical SAM protein [Candidatus Lokiarchaeota archaeon]